MMTKLTNFSRAHDGDNFLVKVSIFQLEISSIVKAKHETLILFCIVVCNVIDIWGKSEPLSVFDVNTLCTHQTGTAIT